MSKDIDFSKPLSADDQQYVDDRPWLLTDARLRGQDVIVEDDFEGDFEDDNEGSGETDAESDLEGESDQSAGEESAEGADEETSGDESEDGEESGEVAPYAEWEYQAIQEEAKNRNLSAKGSKEQLIKRLEEDDNSDPE